MLVTVVCDACGWKRKNQKVKDWHRQPCPVCGHKFIIDDMDMKLHLFFVIAQGLSDLISFFLPNAKTKTIHVSTKEIKEKIAPPGRAKGREGGKNGSEDLQSRKL